MNTRRSFIFQALSVAAASSSLLALSGCCCGAVEAEELPAAPETITISGLPATAKPGDNIICTLNSAIRVEDDFKNDNIQYTCVAQLRRSTSQSDVADIDVKVKKLEGNRLSFVVPPNDLYGGMTDDKPVKFIFGRYANESNLVGISEGDIILVSAVVNAAA